MNKSRKISLFIFIILALFMTIPTFSKYRNNTISTVIKLFTKYNVSYVTTGGSITNLDNFSSYFSSLGLTLPTKDEIERKGYDLSGWYNDTSFSGNAITEIEPGSTGDKTFYASWIPARYALTITNTSSGTEETGLPDGWDLVIGKDSNGNDNIATLDSNGQIIIDKGEIVSLRTKYSETVTSAGWSIDEDILFLERYETGDQYIYYDFKMPRHTVTAKYSTEIASNYVNLSKSPITFEENVDVGNRTQNGFWYQNSISGMVPLLQDDTKGYFYVWDNSEPLYITTNGKATQNQITVVNETTLYLKNCNLVATTDYSTDLIDRKLKDTVMETNGQGKLNDSAKDAWSKYGNIVLDNSINNTYTTNIYLEDTNTIGSIFTSQYQKAEVSLMTVNITGTGNNKLYFGSIFGNLDANFKKLSIEQYSNNTSVQEQYPDNSEYITWTSSGQMTRANSSFNTCTINAPDKRIYSGYGYIYLDATKGTIGSFRHAYNTMVRQTSDVLVLEDSYGYYYGISLSGGSKFVMDSSFRTNGYNSSGVTVNNGELIVKGNFLDAGSLSVTNGTVIANAIGIGSSVSIGTGSTIITNIITNIPNGRPVFNTSTGQYSSLSGTGSLTKANKNDDDIPFITLNNSASSPTKFSFTGGNVYLLGYYELTDGIFDTEFTTESSSNPLKEIIEEYDENGVTNLTDEYLETQINAHSNDQECIIIGDSSNTNRTISFTGTNIHAAGNITLFNDTTIEAGTIKVNGTLSSKRELNITGGEITASEIGNSYNLSTTNNSLSNWSKVNITGGSITTDRIGALSSNINNVTPRSYVQLGEDVTINSLDSTLSTISVVTDIYTNYIYDSLFDVSTSNPKNLRFKGTVSEGKGQTLSNLSLIEPEVEEKLNFEKPILVEDGNPQKWKYSSLSGIEATYLSKDGYINGDKSTDKVYLNSQVNLYAAKENYRLTVNGDNYSATTDGTTVNFTNNQADVKADSKVTLTLSDASLTDKTVVWYRDGSGLLHNAIGEDGTIDKTNGIIKFTMPCADTEIYITEELTLDLSQYNITLTSDGFASEIGGRRSDSNFNYKGDLIIEQSNITRIVTNAVHEKIISSDPISITGKTTTNRIVFEEGSSNNQTNDRKITLRKIKQNCSVTHYGIDIFDGEEIVLTISGPVRLYPVHITENSTITFQGDNPTEDILNIVTVDSQSAIMIGNSSGKAGNVRFENVWIQNHSSRIVYSSTKTTNSVEFNNVIMDTYVYYRSTYIHNMGNVTFINSDIQANYGGDTAQPLFESCDNVTLTNTKFNYTSGEGRSYRSLFYGMNNLYINGTSEIIYNLRNTTSAKSFYETLNYGSNYANLVKVSDSAILRVDHRLRIEKLVIEDQGQVIIDKLGTVEADIDKDTYLLCPDITVNGGQLIADNIIISGFYIGNAPTTETATLNYLKNGTNILNGSSYQGLTITGGVVTARKFVGGDLNGKITVSGGTLNALNIGTSGKLYGFASYLPKEGEEYIYTYSKIPTAATVTVNGGTINVSENGYLGGMNSKVNINNGVVNIDTNSILGITESDKTILINDYTSKGLTPSNFITINITNGEVIGSTGDISVPYGTLNVSGSDTGINVKNIISEKGNVNISDANNKYSNPYIVDYGQASHEQVGIIVKEQLSAQNIIITNGAIVYAKMAVANAIDQTDEGLLRVSYSEPIAYLYSDSYGSTGKGTSVVDVQGNALLHRQYSIFYNVNDTYQDQATNPNQSYYVTGIGLTLWNATRYGYDFAGWYDENGNKISVIDSTLEGDITLEARWIAKKVQFRVSINATEVGIDTNNFADEIDLTKGTLSADGTTFTFNNLVEVGYKELLVSANGLQLPNYNLNSYIVVALKINNETLNPDQDDLILTSATVTKELMDYYLSSGEPLELSITAVSKK